jgi:predicted small secreted protein
MAHLRHIGRVALVVLGLGALGACNTVQGMGRDIEAGGQAITNAARTVQSKM